MSRLRRIRIGRGLTLNQVACAMDLSNAQISRLETGSVGLTIERLEKFADVYGVSVSELLEDRHIGSGHVPIRRLPRVSLEAIQNLRKDAMRTLRRSWNGETILAPTDRENAFALPMPDTAMSRYIPKGALILIDPDDTDLVEGRRYLVRANHMVQVRQYCAKDGPARFEPRSTVDGYPTIFVDDSREIEVLGRAFMVTQEI